ncbi:MAG: DUF4861 family protein [Verrucomicrobia bacterium]|nr:DUF4861 family protein [Verrucomicrobiota bacterium]
MNTFIRLWFPLLVFLLVNSNILPAQTVDGFAACRFVPERADDFAFENDKVAFRIYGPALKDSLENSGIDCWLKRVNYPIIDKWYKGAQEGKSYHKDHGEGYDPYHVGDSLGCGGLALWMNGQMHISNVYRQYRILKNGPNEAVFEVEYIWEELPREMHEVRRYTLAAGSQLFKVESQIFIAGKPAQREVAIGVTTQNGLAQPYADRHNRWVAAWENIHGSGLGTGVVIPENSHSRTITITSYEKDRSHIILIIPTDKQGRITYYGGFAWEKAGEISSAGNWQNYLTQFSNRISNR